MLVLDNGPLQAVKSLQDLKTENAHRRLSTLNVSLVFVPFTPRSSLKPWDAKAHYKWSSL